MCLYSPRVAGSTLAKKTLVASLQTQQKTSWKTLGGFATSCFSLGFLFCLSVKPPQFFASVDPATLGEYKLLNSICQVCMYEFDIWGTNILCSSLGLLLGPETILLGILVKLVSAIAYHFCLDMPLQHSSNHVQEYFWAQHLPCWRICPNAASKSRQIKVQFVILHVAPLMASFQGMTS